MVRMIGGTLAVAAILVVFSGCGRTDRPTLVPVSGTVLYQGRPVEDAQVTFRTEGAPRAATGRTDEQGRFRLTTYDTNDGAVPGTHTVTIVKVERTPGQEEMSPEDPGEAYDAAMRAAGTPEGVTVAMELPERYADPETSGLQREVVEGDTNEFNFDLD